MASAGRINKEIGVICKPDSTSGVIAAVAPDDQRVPGKPGWRHLVGTITGPEGTAYEGGVFDVDILIPTEYPFEPPKMKFITKIWHPNVSSQTGAICLVSWGRGGCKFAICDVSISCRSPQWSMHGWILYLDNLHDEIDRTS